MPAHNHTWDDLGGDDPGFGSLLVRYLLDLLFMSKLSAKDFCQIMWFAWKAGVGDCKTFCLRPGLPTGHYMRHVKEIMGWNDKERFYRMKIPGSTKHDLERTCLDVMTMPGHELMAMDLHMQGNLEKDARALQDLRADPNGLPPCYWEHPVVRDAAEDEIVFPVAIYLDGAPYSQTDSVIGWWLINLISGQRYLTSVLRKRNICKCGCKGWCTFWRFWSFLRWTLRSLATGRFPEVRDDGQAWDPLDKERALLAGSEFGYKGACLYLKADWAELASTAGFPAWNDGCRPCCDCNAFGDGLYDLDGVTLDDTRSFMVNDALDYYGACIRSEIKVSLRDEDDVQRIVQYLRYDKRTQGNQGRCLTRDVNVNGVSLKVGDRLEPSEKLPDVGSLEDLRTPSEIIFWRKDRETLTRHRNPIFDLEIGLTPRSIMVVDLLHAFFLGILNAYCHRALWALIQSGAYGSLGTAHENLLAAAMVIRSRLFQFYKDHRRAHPEDDLTQVTDFTLNMMNTPDDKKMSTKGAETWGVALFVISELELRGELLGADLQRRLLEAGRHLAQLIQLMRSYRWTLPRSVIKDFAI